MRGLSVAARIQRDPISETNFFAGGVPYGTSGLVTSLALVVLL